MAATATGPAMEMGHRGMGRMMMGAASPTTQPSAGH
jgi:hypothetical protein